MRRLAVTVFCGPDESRVLAQLCEQERCWRETANYLRDVALAVMVTPIRGPGDAAGKVEITFVDGEPVIGGGARRPNGYKRRVQTSLVSVSEDNGNRD